MDCDAIPSCIEMGYTQDSCAGGKGIRCPFDENKFYCAGVKQLPDAPEPVITPEEWTAECADKVDHCTAYNNDCQCTTCEDDYNLADNTCVSKCDKSVDTCAAESKTFNAETCTCKACPTNYKFNATTKTCEEITCAEKSNCIEYDDECNCVACEDGYFAAQYYYFPSSCNYVYDSYTSYCVEECFGLRRQIGDSGEDLPEYNDYEEIYTDYNECLNNTYYRNEDIEESLSGNNNPRYNYYTCDSVPCGDSCYRCSSDHVVYEGSANCMHNEPWVCRDGTLEETNNCSR